MAENSSNGQSETGRSGTEPSAAGPSGARSSGRKRQWFARRQVYLRAGQDSQYVELSPLLQIGVAIGFGALALWLVGASYGAAANFLGNNSQTALLTQLNNTEQALGETQRERDAALRDAERLAGLGAELAEANATLTTGSPSDQTDDTLALRAELEQTREQLEELHLRLSESKSDQAALQARFEAEALATTDESDKTAEEAVSLHAQLEEAFGEMENLRQQRDQATARLAALNEEIRAKDEATERNTALLKAATAEIERLQGAVALAGTEVDERNGDYEAKIGELEEQLGEVTRARDDQQDEVASLQAELEEAKIASLETSDAEEAIDADEKTSADAVIHAQLIATGLREADLLATIDNLRAELVSDTEALADAGNAAQEDDGEVVALQQRVSIAEKEIERLILSGLKAVDEPALAPTPAETTGNPAASERLRSELLTARADNIKLKADVRAAQQRLADQAEIDNGETSKPDNSAKLAQQLASTRTRVQQLNKALANAKLREVAVDLALINVVPSPSPPAPR